MEGPLFDAFLMALLRDFHLNKDQASQANSCQREGIARTLPPPMSGDGRLHEPRPMTESNSSFLLFGPVGSGRIELR